MTGGWVLKRTCMFRLARRMTLKMYLHTMLGVGLQKIFQINKSFLPFCKTANVNEDRYSILTGRVVASAPPARRLRFRKLTLSG